MRKILFITHESSRSGAPLVLLYFLRWLKTKDRTLDILVLSLKKGALSGEFEKVSDKFYEISQETSTNRSLIEKIKGKIFRNSLNPELEKIIKYFGNNINLIYANTIVSLPMAFMIKQQIKGSNIIVHIHELNFVIKSLLPNLNQYSKEVKFWISASDLVKNNLIQHYQISKEKITTIYEFTKIKSSGEKNKKDIFIVGGCGTVEWRKGYDLFIQLAKQISRKYNNKEIRFCWIGNIPPDEKEKINLELRNAGLDPNIFTGGTPEPELYLKNMDILAMTSREDPFPLVCIEAGMLGKPIICFSGATGTEEILRKGGGEIVPYLDLPEMSKQIESYYLNRDKLVKDGITAKKLFSDFTPSIQAPKVYNVIKSMI